MFFLQLILAHIFVSYWFFNYSLSHKNVKYVYITLFINIWQFLDAWQDRTWIIPLSPMINLKGIFFPFYILTECTKELKTSFISPVFSINVPSCFENQTNKNACLINNKHDCCEDEVAESLASPFGEYICTLTTFWSNSFQTLGKWCFYIVGFWIFS